MKPSMRLQKYIALSTRYSRRKAEKLIDEGRISVNGTIVRGQGTSVNTSRDIVELDGVKLTPNEEHLYIMLHKPAGYLSTKSDTHDRKTVIDLIGNKEVYPVGRLDKETEGLLLLTNDGDFAYKVMHPKFEHEKEYLVHLKSKISDEDKNKLEKGIVLYGEKTAPCVISNMKENSCNITIHEGKKRQIRRMFEAIGNKVIYLKRIRIGKLLLGSLKKGEYKIITKEMAETALKKQ